MERTKPLAEQVRANLAKVDAAPQFTGKRVWLTFYLCGPPQNLQTVSQALADDGWLNTDGWEGAFLYPKLEVDRTATAILAVAEAMRALCDGRGIEVLNIDADTTPDVQHSEFVTLYRSPS
jgi:hypothetical protein